MKRRSLMIQNEIKVGLGEEMNSVSLILTEGELRIETIKCYYAINLLGFRLRLRELSDLKFSCHFDVDYSSFVDSFASIPIAFQTKIICLWLAESHMKNRQQTLIANAECLDFFSLW